MAGSFGRARRQIAKNADRAWSIRARRQLGTALGCARLVMTSYLALRLLLGRLLGTSVYVRSSEAASYRDTVPIVKVGLVLEESSASPAEATPDETQSCERVSFSRSLKYGEDDLNVLDVATVASQDSPQPASRPVLLFVAGARFAGQSRPPQLARPLPASAAGFARRPP